MLSRSISRLSLYVLSVLLISGIAQARTWQYEYPVSSGGVAGLWASIKRDSSGDLQVAYVGHGKLMYATGSGSWSTEVANSSGVTDGEAPQWTSLAMAGTTPHISYYDARTNTLKHAWKSTDWQSETVDSAGGVGKYSCIAVDGSGYPAIVYYDEAGDALKYAYRDGSGWHLSTIATGCGEYSSLAFDGSGNAHVAYYDSTEVLKYAKRSGGSWTYETADSTKYCGEMCSLVLDGSGYPHIAYRDGFNSRLKYAWKDGSGWHAEVADSQDRTGFMPAIAIGTDGYPRINYFRRAGWVSGSDFYHLETWYAYKSASGWQKQLIQRIMTTNDQWCLSMALDSSNQPCVAYHYFASKSLNYMHYNGSGWDQETADAGREIGQYASLTLDGSNNPHISYYAMDTPNLYYARKSGSAWSVEQVDSAGDTGGYSSIKMLPSGYPAISYCKFKFTWSDPEYHMGADLKYAYKDGSGWHPSTVQSDVGLYTSLAIQGGQPRISYGDMTYKAQNLRYAQWNGSSWEFATPDPGSAPVDPSPDWHADGHWTSLAFDGSGNPHISYMEHWQDFGATPAEDILLRRLKHAWRSGGAWYSEIVDDGQMGKFTSIAINSSGYPCIAYQDVGNGYLKYAYKTGSGWQKETIDTATATGWYASLALNPSDYPRIAYKEIGGQVLRYAWKDAVGWHTETADTSGRVGDYCSLALTSTGEPYIAYMDWDNLTLKVAYPSPQQYGSISGFVRDNVGQPISQASVTTNVGGYSTLSNPDGSYTLSEVLPGVYNVTASKVGYQSQTVLDVQVSADQTATVNFNLTPIPPGAISGYVKDTGGNPISGATVSTNTGGYSTTSGANGGYSLSVLPGTYNVTASKSGYQSQTQNNVSVSSGATTTVNFNLSPVTYGTISGYVRNTSGTAISGATVSTNTGGYSTTSGSDGGYTLSNVAAGTYNVTASKTGYQSQTQNNISVTAGQTTACNFNLAPSTAQLINGNFEGGFTNGVANGWTKFIVSGSPSFGDETSHVHGGSHAQRWSTNWTTHDAGIYQQVTAAKSVSYTFSAWTWRHDEWNNGGDNEASWVGIDPYGGTNAASSNVQWSSKQISYETWTQQSVSAAAQADTITVFIRGRANWAGNVMLTCADDAALQASPPGIGNISGYVKDAGNNPIIGASVTTGAYTAMSGSDGSYTLANLLAGAYSVTASKAGYQSQTKAGIVVSVGQTTSCSFNLTPNPGSITGYVKDRNTNEPISGATVSTNTGGYSTTTGSDGGYTLSNVAAGTYNVTASKTGYASQTKSNVTVGPGQTANADFSLVTGYAKVSDVKKLPDGRYISLGEVICSRRPNSSLMFVQDADRTAGIKVTAGTGSIPTIDPGTACTVEGRLTSVNNVREITDVQVTTGSSGKTPDPLCASNVNVGGADFFYSAGPPASGQKGSAWSVGVNNVGLLVCAWGRVLDTPAGGVFHIYDGSIPSGLPVKLLSGVIAPAQGTYAVLKGIPEPDGLLLVLDLDKTAY